MEELFKEYGPLLPKSVLRDVQSFTPGTIGKTKLRKILDLVVEEYKNMQVEAGECVGIISAESIGEPGTQMSLPYNEKVIVKSHGNIRIVKIGTFIDSLMNRTENYLHYNDTEVCQIHDFVVFVPALSKNERIEWKKVTAVSRHRAPEQLLQLKTRSGRQITATPYHSFVVRKNNTILPVAGSSLNAGDRIPAVKKIVNLTNNSFLQLEHYLPKNDYIYESELRKAMNKEEDFVLPLESYEQINNYVQGNNKIQLQQNCVYMYQNHSLARIPETLSLDADFGFFIGAYLAEGTYTKHYIAITNISESYLQRIIVFAKKYNINYALRHQLGEYGNSTSVLLYSTLLSDLLLKTCDRGAYNKSVPDFAYTAHPQFVSALLSAYFDGDGNVNVARKVIRASSSSKELIDGIALLLSQFGIFTVKGKNKIQHTLSISYRYASQFQQKIGLEIKRAALHQLAALKKPDQTYDIIDMSTGYGSLLSDIGHVLGIPRRLTHKFTVKQKIGRQTLEKYILLFEKKAAEKNIVIDDELKLLKQMVQSDVVWDEITSVGYVTPTHPFVYDFSVDDLETFTTFDGLVTHNTLNTFHFTGVAEMNITTGLPRIIEVLDGSQTLRTPMMEIYLQEPYKTGQDIKKVAQLVKQTTLEDVTTEFLINIPDSTIEVRLSSEKMQRVSTTADKVHKLVDASLKGISVKLKDESLFIKPKGKEESVNELYKLKERIKSIYVAGVKGVTQVLPVKRGDEFIIVTAGTNLKAVLGLDFVDSTRTISNDLYEIQKLFGIEAVRELVVREVYKVINEQGLNVDIRHLMLVADAMCVTGKLKGITRYGVVSQKSSVLAKASFETPLRHFINASLVGEKDELNSVVENVMVNQPVPLGTGLPGIVTKEAPKVK